MSYRFDFDNVSGPVSHMRVACTSCADYPDETSSGMVADDQGLPTLRPNMAIIIIGLGFTLVVVVAFAVFAKFMRPHMNRLNTAGTSRMWEEVVKDGSSVDAKVIKSLPLVVYSAESFQGLNLDLECAVCLSQFEEGEELRLLPICKHMFHPGCIDGWLRSHPFCPLCRSSVLSTSWAVHNPPDSTALSVPEGSQREHHVQQSPSRETQVEISVLERFEARFEALRDKCCGKKGTRSSGAAELVPHDVHNGDLQKRDGFDLHAASSTSGQENVDAHGVCKPDNCDLSISAVCNSVLPGVKTLDTESCPPPRKGEWGPRLCGDRILEVGSSSSAPSSSEDTCQHR